MKRKKKEKIRRRLTVSWFGSQRKNKPRPVNERADHNFENKHTEETKERETKMSLVDYASSDEDVPAAVEEEEKDNRIQSENHIITEPHLPKHEPRPQSPPLNQ